ncbi:MAG: hypothetical protein PHN31_00055 [Candidatus Gracilibacteria bacterium]|nr:hypothetical protein [Candidatus Gracilibacteria bacterium]
MSIDKKDFFTKTQKQPLNNETINKLVFGNTDNQEDLETLKFEMIVNRLKKTDITNLNYDLFKNDFEIVMDMFKNENITNNLKSKEKEVELELKTVMDKILTVIQIKFALKKLYPQYEEDYILEIVDRTKILDESFLEEIKQQYFQEHLSPMPEATDKDSNSDEKWLLSILE